MVWPDWVVTWLKGQPKGHSGKKTFNMNGRSLSRSRKQQPSPSSESLTVSSRYAVLIRICLSIFLVYWVRKGNQVTYMDYFLLIVCLQTCRSSFPRAAAFHLVGSVIGWGRPLFLLRVYSSDAHMCLYFCYIQAAWPNFSLLFVCRLADPCTSTVRLSYCSSSESECSPSDDSSTDCDD